MKGGNINEKEDYFVDDNLDYFAANDRSIWLCCTCSHTGTNPSACSSPCPHTYTSTRANSCADANSSTTNANNGTR